MNTINQEQIINLDAKELTTLLRKLLYLEKDKYRLPNCYINVPEEINASDGGEDGRIETTDRKKSSWILSNFCIFQCKATKMSAPECKKEMLKSDLKNLKTQIKNGLENNASYILLASKDKVAQNGIDSRVLKIREAIKEAKEQEGVVSKEAITYSNSIKIAVYDSSLIASWVNEHFPAILYVQECNGITRPQGLLDWNGLKSYKQNKSEFYSNEKIDDLISIIQKKITQGKNLRIEGSSGIGKTRLICESLAPNNILIDKTLNTHTVYSDIANGSNDLLNFVKSHNNLKMTLVLDNCSPKAHDSFLRECSRTGSNITLVSIDYEKVNNPLLNEYTIIELKDHDYKSVTKDVLNNQYKQILSDQDIDYLVNFSEGNTKMAIDFAEASIKEIQLNQTLNRELIKKLIYGRDEIIEDEFEILKILSVFKAFEFPDTSYYSIDNNHYNQLLENVKFISEYFSIDIEKVKKTINKFIKKGSIERRGHFIVLRPTPLALKLSLLFWEDFPPENYSGFIEAIPSQMRKELTLQLERVGNVKEAKEVVTAIWGLNGNFSTAEMLNSNSGSLLFRSIVNVNPIEAVKVLKKNYLNKTTEELTEIVDSRQNLVWSLEKLCFRKETFSDASKVLMSFAVAEIETFYSNNSTSYFKQLFRLYLAGTEVNYHSRLEILYWALDKKNSDFDLMVIKACKSALNGIHNNVRMLGAENQGSQLPLKEYQPENLLEIHDYINNILIILKRLQSNYLNEINKLIRLSLYFFIEINYNFNELKSFFEHIIENKESKHEFRKTLIGIRSDQSHNQNPSQIEIVDEFISKTEPQTIEEQIKDIVSTPKYIFSKDREIDISKEKSEAFAKKIINEGIDLKKYLSNLFLGEQYQTFNFGKKYAELTGFDKSLLDEIIIFLTNLKDDDNWNISFLHGYLSEFSAEIKKHVFYKFLEKKSKISFLLFRNIGSTLNDALKLIELITIDNQKNLTQIGYGLLSFDVEDFITFLNKLNPILENKSPILDFIYNFLNTNNTFEHKEAVLQWLNKLMDKHNLLENVNNSYHLDYYYWQKTMEMMLLTNPAYVSSITEQIISYHKANFTSFTGDIHITKVAMLTLEIDFELSWSNYSRLLINENDYLYFYKIFDFGIFSLNKNEVFFSNKVRNKKILSWLKLYPETAEKLIKNAPLFSDSGGWFDFTFKMIIEFGDKKEFLDELSSNFHSMITGGSRVPALESRKKLLEELLHLNIPELTIWTEKQIEYFNREIKIEKIKNEQGDLF